MDNHNKQLGILAYKLLHDALALWLFAYAVFLIAEGLYPGFISSHISFAKSTGIILVLIFSISLLGKQLGIQNENEKQKNRRIPLLFIFSFFMIANSLLRFAFWENIIITAVSLFVIYLFYQILILNEA